MEQLRNYIIIPADLPNCISELRGDKLTLNHLFWDKFCTNHRIATTSHVLHTIFRKMLGITYIENKDSLLDNYVWDDKKNSYFSTPTIWNN